VQHHSRHFLVRAEATAVGRIEKVLDTLRRDADQHNFIFEGTEIDLPGEKSAQGVAGKHLR
jgi:hypothetical protein